EQLATRDDAIKAAMHYPQGLNAAKTFAAVNAPFAPDAYRYENGQVMAGPDCKFAPGCQNISTQSLQIFERLGDVQTRVVAVDERMGIVWLRMAWAVREGGGEPLEREVRSLLSSAISATPFFETPVFAARLSATAVDESTRAPAVHVGDRIGPYRIIEEIGRGGMGAVFLAERAEEYQQRV